MEQEILKINFASHEIWKLIFPWWQQSRLRFHGRSSNGILPLFHNGRGIDLQKLIFQIVDPKRPIFLNIVGFKWLVQCFMWSSDIIDEKNFDKFNTIRQSFYCQNHMMHRFLKIELHGWCTKIPAYKLILVSPYSIFVLQVIYCMLAYYHAPINAKPHCQGPQGFDIHHLKQGWGMIMTISKTL